MAILSSANSRGEVRKTSMAKNARVKVRLKILCTVAGCQWPGAVGRNEREVAREYAKNAVTTHAVTREVKVTEKRIFTEVAEE